MARLGTLLVAALAGSILPAAGSAAVVVSGPLSGTAGFYTPAAVAVQGVPLTHVNTDNAVYHNVEAVAFGPDTNPWCASQHFARGRCPLFWSPLIPFGSTAAVQGVDGLTSGQTYPFRCVLHAVMTGMLVVA